MPLLRQCFKLFANCAVTLSVESDFRLIRNVLDRLLNGFPPNHKTESVSMKQDLAPYLLMSILLSLWTISLAGGFISFDRSVGISQSSYANLMLRNRQRDSNIEGTDELFPHRTPLELRIDYDIQKVNDGFENPNNLPKLLELGDADFFEILAPAYYGKSPMDGSRNYEIGSTTRSEHCRTQHNLTYATSLPAEKDHDFALETELCSYGPELVYKSYDDIHAAHLMHEVCLSFNIDSRKQVQRGLLVFDPQNSHKMRCVPCPNPVEFMRWGKHACGLMWNHQINAKSLADFAQCVEENEKFLGEIGQRQTPAGNDLEGGTMHAGAVLELSFARGNPGHQSFDSLLTLLPIIFPDEELTPFRVIVHQSPECPDSEWICGLLRKIGFFNDHALVPVNATRMSCFDNLIVPKWGMARESRVPERYLRKLRNNLHEKFEFAPRNDVNHVHNVANKPNLLLYAHDTISVETKARRRSWLDMSLLTNHTKVLSTFGEVRHVTDFAALSIAEQGAAFYDADVIAMPHGGQMGNIIFARQGSVVVEIACYPYSHFGMTNAQSDDLPGLLPKSMGLIHIVLVPCVCNRNRDVDSNFYFGPKSLVKLYNTVKHYRPGTYLYGKRHSDEESRDDEIECFGSKD